MSIFVSVKAWLRWLLYVQCCFIGACSNSADMKISSDFESAAVEQVRVDWNNNVHFSLPAKPDGKERLWFYFRVNSSTPISPHFIIDNPSDAHQGNWDVVRPVFSVDGKNWVRAVDTKLGWGDSMLSKLIAKIRGDEPDFRFRSPVSSKELWVAYSYPYTSVDLDHFLDTIRSDKRVHLSSLGHSEQGREIKLLSIEGSGSETSKSLQDIWVVCREHPGESPASYVLEGLVDELLKGTNGQRLLSKFRFNIVPMFNIDGVTNGAYYRNVMGIDIAQDWETFQSAEVRALHEAMRKGLESDRVALVLDLHSANEPRSHFFIKTPPKRLSPELAELQHRLIQSAKGVHPQLQIAETIALWDYPVIAGNFLSKHYGVYCLYLESNYSIGADGTIVTPESLRALGEALIHVVTKGLLRH